MSEPRPAIRKLRERKERHKQRGLLYRGLFVVGGVLIVLGGLLLSLPGVPGPGLVLVAAGLGILALEFDPAERLLERILDPVERARERSSTFQQALVLAAGACAAVALFVAFLVWDVPVLPG